MDQRGHDLREVFNALRWLVRAGAPWRILPNCRIPDDCIDTKRYPLFLARAVLKELIESLRSTPGAKPC